jgi:GNAT superfamily N-acetyltransferase
VYTRPVDLSAPDEFRRCYSILREAELFERPDAPMWSERELFVMFSHDDPSETMTAYGAFDGDTMVGAGLTALPLLDNVDKAFLHVAVAPALRRRGIGSTMVETLVETSREAGRTVMLAESWLPPKQRDSHPYRSFAEKNGFELANIEIRRVLRLPVPTEQLQAWAAEAAPYHRDYTIATYVDDIPDELVESYVHVRNQLALDAPTGDIDLEAEALTPEAYRERQAIAKEQGRTTYHALAIDRSGQTVAYTSMGVPSDEPVYIHQWGTLVRRDHRGHRLGMAVKVANLAAVQAACPDRAFVNTQNAETNGPMVAINERLGFRPVDELAEFQRFVTV